MLTDYPGLVMEMYNNFGPRTLDYDQAYNAMPWPADGIEAVYLQAEPPPFSIQRPGDPGESVSPGSLPAFITPETANVTGWQDYGVTAGYPVPMGTEPTCNQTLPLTTNWAAGYMPKGQASLTAWLAQNPVEAMLLGLLALAAGAVASRNL